MTANVEPQITVMKSRYLSARGKTVGVFCSIFIALLFVDSGCKSRDTTGLIPREQFVQIYADILYTGELYRSKEEQYRRALDSLLHVRNVDSAQVRITMDWYASRPKELASLYEDVIVILEKRTKPSKEALRKDN